MIIPRNQIDDAEFVRIKNRANASFEDLPLYLNAARRNQNKLGMLSNEALAGASSEIVIDHSSPRISPAMLLAAQARAALFTAAFDQEYPVSIRLGGGEAVTYDAAPEESIVNAGAWLEAFYLNVICGEWDAVHMLSDFPNEILLRSSTKANEYFYFYKNALCAYINNTDQVVDSIMAALRATHPSRSDIYDLSYALQLVSPQLQVLMYVVSEDPKFEETLGKALLSHRDYYNESQENKRDWRGYFSVPLTGLAALALDRGMTVSIQSPYLPMHLVKL